MERASTAWIVLILPMRNGNMEKMRLRGEYKEVLILPMRNGNLFPDGCIRRYASSFLSYLWGMETAHLITFSINNNFCSYPTYEEWKPSGLSVFVLTILKRSYPTYEEWKLQADLKPSASNALVLILPMRNGNTIHSASLFSIFVSSYPTYEEWKQWM